MSRTWKCRISNEDHSKHFDLHRYICKKCNASLRILCECQKCESKYVCYATYIKHNAHTKQEQSTSLSTNDELVSLYPFDLLENHESGNMNDTMDDDIFPDSMETSDLFNSIFMCDDQQHDDDASASHVQQENSVACDTVMVSHSNSMVSGSSCSGLVTAININDIRKLHFKIIKNYISFTELFNQLEYYTWALGTFDSAGNDAIVCELFDVVTEIWNSPKMFSVACETSRVEYICLVESLLAIGSTMSSEKSMVLKEIVAHIKMQ